MVRNVTRIVGFKKVTIGFIIVLIIVLINAIFSTISLQNNRSKVNKTINVLSPYVETMEQLNLMITQSKMLVTNWVYLQANETDKQSLKKLHQKEYPILKKKILAFPEQLDASKDTKLINNVIKQFEELLIIEKEVMSTLNSFDTYEDPLTKFSMEEIIEVEVLPRSEKIFTDLGSILKHKRSEMTALKDNMINSFTQLVFSVIFSSISLVFLVYLAGIFIRQSITRPVIKMQNVIFKLGRGEIPTDKLEVSNDVIGEMTLSVNTLSSSFKTTSEFANQIGSGNLKADFSPLSDQDLLGNALLSMRENLRAYSEEMEQKVEIRTLELKKEKEKVEYINQELEKLSIVASETDNAIVIANHTGNIEWVNAGFIKLFGYDLDEFKKACGGSLLNSSANPDIKEIMQYSIEHKTPVIYEVENITKDGKKLWIQSTLTPIIDDNGEIKKLVIIDSNITAQKEAEEVVLEQNKDILDSILYAKRIQQAILPSEEAILTAFPSSFVIFRPKDIVSGDFYWFHKIGSKKHQKTTGLKYVFAAVDCTGHGVPGAFMSMIGNNTLNMIAIEDGIIDPGQILSEMNRKIKHALHQNNYETSETRDGMDAVIIVVDPINNTLEYAGANRPLYIIRPNVELTETYKIDCLIGETHFLEELKPNKQALGGLTDANYQYNTVKLDLTNNETIYLTSDGYCDQFGWINNKKFMTKKFKNLILSIQDKNLDEQKIIIEAEHDDWKGEIPQVDDILVAGFKMRF